MSYRELRNLCEMTRTLRYPRLMSIENFRTPNFQLVAELLEWIVRKFSPESTLNAQNLQNETDRVNFVKQAVMLMLQNSRLKMNPKKLYQADGHAVQELIPALKILYDARFDDNSANTELTPAWTQVKNKLMSKIQEVRITRQLSAQLPETGAALSELLSKQEFIAQQHERAAARAVPLQEAEKTLKLTISAVAQEAEQLTSKLNNVASDEAELDEKIERKKREYEQMQKRYAKLQSFRPQYMDEYERYEEKLKNLYELYVLNFRNLTYLQKIHDDLAKSERFRQEENEKAMRLAVEKMRLEQEKKNDLGLNDDEIDAPLVERRGSVRKVYGNMTGAGMDSDSDDEDVEGEGGAENSGGAQPKVLENSDDDIDDDIEDFGDIDENPRGKRRSEEEDKNDLSSGDDF